MGDLVHTTDSSQRATNQQQGVSNRDVGGSVITIGANAVSGNSKLLIQSLDPAALNVAAMAVHEAIAGNEAISQQAAESYQKALTVQSETTHQALELATNGAGSGQGVLGTGINPSTLIWGAVAVVALVLIVGVIRK